MAAADYPEEDELARARPALPGRRTAPPGARPIGMLSLVRREPDSFTVEEVELAALLGRLVATAVQNIRAYEAERETVEELRRLSALRADFVSLVSHELRSPMAAVIGAARTLQQRWRELSPDQRESFLALIGDETGTAGGPDRRTCSTPRGSRPARSATASPTSTSASSCATPSRPRSSARTRCALLAQRAATAAGRARRRRAPAPGADEPDRQRGQVLAGRRRRRGARVSRGRPRLRRRPRPRARDRQGRPAADLREVRPGHEHRHDAAGHRARPLHRPLDRRGPRRRRSRSTPRPARARPSRSRCRSAASPL